MAKVLKCMPTTIKKANAFIKEHHRHHRPTTRNSGRWAISAIQIPEEKIVGVAVVGNPVSASLMDGRTLEITRLCTLAESPKGTCSFILSRCCKIWKLMGGNRIITYTLENESGASLRGAGWKISGYVNPHKRWENKSRYDGINRDLLDVYQKRKIRWEMIIN